MASKRPTTTKADAKAKSTAKDGATPKRTASAGKATAAARAQGGRAATARKGNVDPPAARPAQQPVRQDMLDWDTRNQIAGIVVGVIGLALLVSVLTPSSAVLTSAVSSGLHALLGVGAFLVPVALLIWAVSFFVDLRLTHPARIAMGLGLVSLAVIGLVGITTGGAEANPAAIMAPSILAARGGFIGNGLAWLLLRMMGKVVGIIVLVGILIAGIVVVGVNFQGALQRMTERARSRAEFNRAQSVAKANARVSARPQANPDGGAGWAPTVLFDPRGEAAGQQGRTPSTGQPTTLMDQQTTYLAGYTEGIRQASVMFGAPAIDGGAKVDPDTFGCGNVPMQGIPQTTLLGTTSVAQRLTTPVQSPESQVVPVQHTMAFPSVGQCAASGQGNPAPVPAPADLPGSCGTPEQKPRTAPVPRKAPKTWWDSKADAKRDQFDPMADPMDAGVPIPGLLPGAQGITPVYPEVIVAPTQVDDPSGHASTASSGPGTAVTPIASTAPAPAPAVKPLSAPSAKSVARPVVMPSTRTVIAKPVAPLPVEEDFDGRDLLDIEDIAPWEDPVANVAEAEDDTMGAFGGVASPNIAKKTGRNRSGGAPSVDFGAQVSSFDHVIPDSKQDSALSLSAAVNTPSGGSGPFVLPDAGILSHNNQGFAKTAEQEEQTRAMAQLLQNTLNEFGVKAQVADWVDGPTCTTYEVTPGEGVRVNKFTSLENDLARTLACSSVRIYAPVPGTSYVGIEVPNTIRQSVFFGDVLPCVDGGPLDFAVGLDANGKPVHVDLAKLPHLLIAGSTGSGKSVMMNTIIASLLMRCTPDDVRIIMVDPKQVELSGYNGIPHLIMPVVSDMRQAAAALQWGVTEMDRRYKLFSNYGARNLKTFNDMAKSGQFQDQEFPLTTLPSVVIIIDELTDLMMVAKKDVEASIVRIAQLGRAAGIHLVMATQRPSVNVVTGLIKANVACRMSFKVASAIDSKVILDQTGAEKLLGNGDMLFLQTAWGDKPRRIQGCFLSDDEIAQIVTHLKQQGAPSIAACGMAPLPGRDAIHDDGGAGESSESIPGEGPGGASDDDPLSWEAARLVVETQMGSTSMLQRRLKLGYARAGRVMDMLEEMGVVGPARGSKPRDVLVRNLDELATILGADPVEEVY